MEQQLYYRVVRSNRKTVSLRIERDGSVVVRAPYRVGKASIDDFVKRHEKWVYSKLQARKDFVFDLSDGKELVLFGSTYLICSGETRLDGNCIYLPDKQREEAFIRLLKKFSSEVLAILTREIARKYGFCYERIRISSARSRWGSCNRHGVISYSFRVAFLTPSLCEYIIVHELCHTKYFNHGKEFWNEVEKILPQSSTLRKELKKCSGIMNIL